MQLYFVAVQIPSPIDLEIKAFQQEMADQFESSRQLRIPVHITLIPPFRNEREDKVLEAFEKAVEDLTFNSDIELNGFDQFREKVLFVAVQPNETLSRLRTAVFNSITNSLSIDWPGYTKNFHPHITIANRDLKHDTFKKAWPIYKDRPYKRSFDKIEVVLYKHVNSTWQVRSSKVISE